MKKTEKAEVVSEIEEKLKKAVSAVLTDYRGLNVNDLAELRGELRKEGVEYKVYKNTLMKRAAEKADLAELAPHLNGPTALAFSF
ncbi:MAG: 50S ribosomal protein L10, partial [Actinomycetia bacterium]|nr:50S ribosomal protein L10 [Actinomycetes bacterium]